MTLETTEQRVPGPTRAYAWFVVGILWVVVMLNYADRQAIFSLFPLLRKELSASNVALGSIASVFLWVYAGLSPFAGYIGDRFRRRDVIIASLVLWSIVTFTTGLATSTLQLIILRALMGVSEACYMPTGLALIADYHPPSRRSTAVALHQNGVYIGIIVGGVWAGYLGDHVGWRSAFYSLGGLGIVLAVLLHFVLRDAPRKLPQDFETAAQKPIPQVSLWQRLVTLVKIPTVLLLSVVVMVFSVYFWILTVWLPLFFYQEFGMNLTQAAFTATFYSQIASVAGILVGRFSADYLRRFNVRARMWVQFAGIIAPAPFLLLLGVSRSLTMIVIAMIVFGFGRGVWDCNNMPILCDVVRPEMRASAYGLYNFAGMAGGGAGTFLVGALMSWIRLRAILSSTAPFALLAGTLLWYGARRFLARDMSEVAATESRNLQPFG